MGTARRGGSRVHRWTFLLGVMAFACLSAIAQDTANQPPSQPANQPSNQPQTQQPAPPAPPEQTPPQESTPPQNPPQAPTQEQPQVEQKDEGTNPAEAEKGTAVQSAGATKTFGEKTLDKVRDWERGWMTGPYIAKDRARVPLTAKQRQQIYLLQTFTTPSAYIKRMFLAGYDQMRDSPTQWGQGWGAYGERFASREGQFIAANSMATLGNAMVKYEPRYDQCSCSGFLLRTRHAIVRTFVTYDQSEENLRPQLPLFGAAFAAGMLSSTWKPHPQNVWADGGWGVLGQVGGGMLLDFFTEFAGDINRKIGARRRGGKSE